MRSASSSTEHSREQRELVVSDFLSANLPRAFDFVTGEIVTPNNKRSGQVDVIVLPHAAPRFQLSGSVCLALVHATAAALEIKSKLTTSAPDCQSELTKAMNTTFGIKKLPIDPRLNPWPWNVTEPERRTVVLLQNIPVAIVAFEGPNAPTLQKHLHEWEKKAGRLFLPNTVTCLKPNYTLILNDGWLKGPEQTDAALYIQIPDPGSCLAHLFFHLMKTLQRWSHYHPPTPLEKYL